MLSSLLLFFILYLAKCDLGLYFVVVWDFLGGSPLPPFLAGCAKKNCFHLIEGIEKLGIC